jgi:molecular chaperone HscB
LFALRAGDKHMICWSCEKNAGDDLLCGGCGAVQPPDPGADHFKVFGLPCKFDIDVIDLEQRYKEMTKILHPDRYAKADPRARRASLERSVQLNQAWRTLSSPVNRAEYLLSLAGIDVGENPGSRSGESSSNRATQPMDTSLLIEVMELRETMAEARAKGDKAKLGQLAAGVQSLHDNEMSQVASSFAENPPNYPAIAARMVAARYYRRFLEEARGQHDDESDGL